MQVVGYDSLEGALLVSRDGAVEREPLDPGRELAFSLGDRRCAGVVHGDEHVSCHNTRAPYCDLHTSTWVCAKCTGTCLKDEMDCYEEHAVYLAAFAPRIFKVGVTRLWRLETRLREQGAQHAAHLFTTADGRIARELEAELARDLVDRVRVPDKVEGLHRPVDSAAWERLLAEYEPKATFAFDYGLTLEAAPVPETIATGTVVGNQGRLLVLERGGTTYAVDMRDLVGYELEEGSSGRNLQASLGSFG